jgi:hypothetical protein
MKTRSKEVTNKKKMKIAKKKNYRGDLIVVLQVLENQINWKRKAESLENMFNWKETERVEECVYFEYTFSCKEFQYYIDTSLVLRFRNSSLEEDLGDSVDLSLSKPQVVNLYVCDLKSKKIFNPIYLFNT